MLLNRSWLALQAVALPLLACSSALPPEHPATFAPPAQATMESAQKPKAETRVSWSSDAPPPMVPEMQGKPVTMAAGARCKVFRRLPEIRFTQNTLIRDACLEIPNDTTIQVLGPVTLAIVATNGLLVGKNVTFSARGVGGRRGARSDFASVSFSPATDAEIEALCNERGNQCTCPRSEASLAAIRGHAGERGSAGGNLRLIAAELVSKTQLTGFGIDVTGGAGGPPGDSGAQECTRGKLRCSSQACSEGVVVGSAGRSGTVFIALGGANPTQSLERMKAGTIPAESATALVVLPGVALAQQASTLEDEAVQRGWNRFAGEDDYRLSWEENHR